MDMDMETNQISVTITAKEDEKLTFTELRDASNEVMDRISDIKAIDTIGAMAGGSSTMSMMGGGEDSVSMYILLAEDADAKASEVADEITERTKDMDCVVSCSTSSMDAESFLGNGLSVRIEGNNLGKLQDLAKQVASILTDTKGTIDVDNGLGDAVPQLTISVDKEKAAKYGMTVAQVFQLVNKELADARSVTTISTDIKDYQVYLQTEEQADPKLSDIKKLTFTHKNKDGEEEEIPLTKIAKMEESTTLGTISRTAQNRYLTVSCGIDEKHNVTLVGNQVQKQIDKLDVPEGYNIEMAGEDETINESMSQLLLMLLLAVIFIYLIMVVQFQSLSSPFIIMFSIPLAFTGGFLALYLTGQEVSVIAMLGFIMLAGLIVNNGIVLIDYINQARKSGMSKKNAIIDSGKTRVRPILMTALTIQLAFRPEVITSLGFQLSYLAMTGITLLYPHLSAWYPDNGRAFQPIRRIWQAAALAVSCQIFTAPLAWIRFHNFPKYFIITNLLALPLTSALMAASVAAIAFQALGGCPALLADAVDFLAHSLLFVLDVISSL